MKKKKKIRRRRRNFIVYIQNAQSRIAMVSGNSRRKTNDNHSPNKNESGGIKTMSKYDFYSPALYVVVCHTNLILDTRRNISKDISDIKENLAFYPSKILLYNTSYTLYNVQAEC